MMVSDTKKISIDRKDETILLLDGECALCNRLALFLSPRIRKRKQVKFIAIESSEGRELIQSFPKKLRDLDTIYFLDGSKIHFYSSAVLRCLGLLHWHYVLLVPFLWIVPSPLRDIFYRVVARYRRKIFGQSVSCTFANLNEARNKEV
ncbi:MAG: Uncharacterised protein [Acidimicrobiales bacterium AG-410-I20]|nr:MAG: Uncharacterised protein [Acidimicrobiales bacterium AG-410-I20]